MYFYFTRGTLLLSGKDDSPRPEVFGESHAGEGREVQVRHQER